MSQPSDGALQVQGLSKRYVDRVILDDLDLCVAKGPYPSDVQGHTEDALMPTIIDAVGREADGDGGFQVLARGMVSIDLIG